VPISDLIPWKKQESNISKSEKQEWEEFFDLQEEMNQIFENVLTPWQSKNFSTSNFRPEMDIRENEQEITITADLPGMDPDQINLKISGRNLTISGERATEKEEKGERFYRKERFYGSFQRSIPLPEAVDEEKIKADYQQGVLRVVLPKSTPSQQSRKSIPIKSG
jgi:HSP20 family protein